MKTLAFVLCVFLSFNAWSSPVWYPLPPEAYKFGNRYPDAQRLLYAFDYGHALVYERLLQNRGKIDKPKEFEAKIMAEIMAILRNPPRVKVDESDIAPVYVYTFPLTVDAFDWSHMLHQFVLDILATSNDRGSAMQQRVNAIFAQYQANSQLAITDVCKSMLFMDGQYFSKAFRRTYPSFNLLIWSYHWFQIKLYEALMAPKLSDRDKGVAAVVAQFWTLISDLPDSADFDMMPQTAKEAPSFAKMFPNVPPAFDNNHMLHDIVSDILVSPRVADADLRKEGVRTARMAQDPEAFRTNNCGADSILNNRGK